MKEQKIIADFSEIIWKEIQGCVEYLEITPENIMKKANIVLCDKSSIGLVNIWKIFQKQGSLVRETEETNFFKVNDDSESIFEHSLENDLKGIIIIKPHVHSLDNLMVEIQALQYKNRKVPIYIYAYESEEFFQVEETERHICCLKLYWQMVEWFHVSGIKRSYNKE